MLVGFIEIQKLSFIYSDERTAKSALCIPIDDLSTALLIIFELAMKRASLQGLLQGVLILLRLWERNKSNAKSWKRAPLVSLLHRFQSISVEKSNHSKNITEVIMLFDIFKTFFSYYNLSQLQIKLSIFRWYKILSFLYSTFIILIENKS